MKDLAGMSFSHLPHVHIAPPQIQFLLHRDCIRLEMGFGISLLWFSSCQHAVGQCHQLTAPRYISCLFFVQCTDTQVLLTATAVTASEAQNTEELRRTMKRLGNETKEPQHSLQLGTAV